jgi:hypothetical protein
LLGRHQPETVRVFTVWEPILLTDVAPPLSAVLRRMPDPRVHQFWDPRHAVSDQMMKDARAPQPQQDCCDRRGYLWDLAAVYPPGAMWTDRMPTATVFNGTVMDIADQLAAALQATVRPGQ